MNIFFQPDPTKVESAQDVLVRAAAKGLLGGIFPEESKKGKKKKHRKAHRDPPDSKPSSPSSHDGETGNEFQDGHDPPYAAGHDEKSGEDEHENGEGRKKREAKGRRPKVKRRPKQSAPASKKYLKDTRKAAKQKQQSQHRRHPRRRRARKIPRLTLSFMSSAEPSSRLSTITALAHKLSENAAAEPRLGPDFSPRLAAPPPAATRRPNTEAGGAEKPLRSIKAATSRSRAATAGLQAEPTTQVESEVTHLLLPPISRSSVSQHHSQASRSKKSASSSVSLLGL